ncbi:N2227-domain-containing protein [Phlyctochytrium arcticum]|nr:N2227-domain-containing protein [Phlyctochytrium arcticum]
MFLNDPDSVPEEDRLLEAQHFSGVIRAFKQYRLLSLTSFAKRRRDLGRIPKAHQQLIQHSVIDRITKAEQRVNKNFEFINQIIEGHDDDGQQDRQDGKKAVRVTESDLDKVRTTLRQFVRDWSEEGRSERDVTYGPILDELEARFPMTTPEERGQLKVLVPGAGLGRLAFDIVKRGFSCQGNEFSFYMLLGSNFILNKCVPLQFLKIYPWIHTFSNSHNNDSILRAVKIPDVVPGDLPSTADFSMVAGDFCEVYGDESQKGMWDVIVTCFFVDTAKNIVEYLEIIKNALKPGGVWINLGPLLYHWEGMSNDVSVELTLEELKALATSFGFKIENERSIKTTYTGNSTGMLKYVYECDYFCAVKQNPKQSK